MSQQLFIPSLGTIIVLAEDWTFKLFFEGRNNTLLMALCPNKVSPMPDRIKVGSWEHKYYGKWFGTNEEDHQGSDLLKYQEPLDEKELEDANRTYRSTSSERKPYLLVTMPAGQQLKFDRIYIRAGITAYNSVTFRTTKIGPDKKFHSKRFWVKLQDANNVICNVVG
jgi:hypothetical protein